jgi:hypothetical protein
VSGGEDPAALGVGVGAGDDRAGSISEVVRALGAMLGGSHGKSGRAEVA